MTQYSNEDDSDNGFNNCSDSGFLPCDDTIGQEATIWAIVDQVQFNRKCARYACKNFKSIVFKDFYASAKGQGVNY